MLDAWRLPTRREDLPFTEWLVQKSRKELRANDMCAGGKVVSRNDYPSPEMKYPVIKRLMSPAMGVLELRIMSTEEAL